MSPSLGQVDRQTAQGQTATGAEKETFGTGSAAQSAAGQKGADISGIPRVSLSALGLCVICSRLQRFITLAVNVLASNLQPCASDRPSSQAAAFDSSNPRPPRVMMPCFMRHPESSLVVVINIVNSEDAVLTLSLSAAGASAEERKARGQKAADTRAERYGEQRHT